MSNFTLKNLKLFSVLFKLAILVSLQSCSSQNTPNDPSSKTWDQTSFKEITKSRLDNNQIDCSEYLNYLTYPFTKNEFSNKSMSFVYHKIDSIILLYVIESSSKIDSTKTLISLKEVNSEKDQMEFEFVYNNKLEENLTLQQVELDIWISNFEYFGTFSYNSFENPIIHGKQININNLYIPISKLLQDISNLGHDLEENDLKCFKFKLKSCIAK